MGVFLCFLDFDERTSRAVVPHNRSRTINKKQKIWRIRIQKFWRFRQPQVSEEVLLQEVLVVVVVDVRECQGPLRLPEGGGIEVTTAFGMVAC